MIFPPLRMEMPSLSVKMTIRPKQPETPSNTQSVLVIAQSLCVSLRCRSIALFRNRDYNYYNVAFYSWCGLLSHAKFLNGTTLLIQVCASKLSSDWSKFHGAWHTHSLTRTHRAYCCCFFVAVDIFINL